MRPGAYINFEGVPSPSSNVGERGIVTLAAPLTWGPEDTLIPLYSTDLLNGKSQEKVGVTAFDSGSLLLREALSSAYLALVYRADVGGAKAQATIGELQVVAKYPGTTGNRIAVSIRSAQSQAGTYDVITYLDGVEKDRQTVEDGEDLEDNGWVTFQMNDPDPDPDSEQEPENSPAAYELTESTGVTLIGGLDGTVSASAYTGYFAKAAQAQWNVMAVPTDEPSVKAQVLTFIRTLRETNGRKRQAVVCNDQTADYEGIINVAQGYVNTAGEKITPDIFTATVAGMTAAAAVNQSNTYRAVDGAVEILNPIADEDVEAELKKGRLVLTHRQDGTIVVEQDINSLHSFTPSKDYAFSKNRVIRVLDDIGNQILSRFETAYIGKVDNNDTGRNVFKADVISYMNELQGMGAIQNFDPASDITVTQGMAVDAVSCELWVQPVDAMEKLYMLVNVGG